ncbi:hypothetical protein Pd630_LPD03784 [Rhodococcus opacus PD630]|nr:hypothetical protein [Rhodococcus opacus]AHK30997.1 hypothetical protein Pd630_LPD03784 [Rhodococcus opacus PD630]UDH00511.1 hypothetical protein K2Z90_003599 [Rhodococcus opacus PD630]
MIAADHSGGLADPDEAFPILATRSQLVNIPVNEVAVNVIEHRPDHPD